MPRSLPVWVLTTLSLFLLACPPDDGSVAPPTMDLRGKSAGDLDQRRGPAATDTGTDTAAAASAEAVQVCVLLPSSGSSEDEAAEMRRGMAIAQAQLKAEKWRKRKVVWIEKDTKSTEAGAVAAYHECMVKGAPIIIGPVHPAAVTAIIPIAAAHKVMLIIPDLGAAQASRWNTNLFAITPPATDMGRVAAHNARVDRGMGRALILHTPEIFGESLARAFTETFTADRGGKIVATLALSAKNPDAWTSAAIKTALSEEADSIFVVAPGEVAAAVARSLSSEPLRHVQAWFIDWAMYPSVIEAAGKAIQRVHWVNRPLPRGDFEDIFLSRYQAYPNFAAGAGYDAVVLAATAIQTAQSMGPAHLSLAAAAVKDLAGAFGTGALVEKGGIVSEDAAGYRPVEPTREPDSETWTFSGY